ncbi:hypothetical protein RFI_29710 [Reticulomyxa filosa]|uniref:Uncharacterized protein n=1 Tax=Reticulomyxa filosa TaxID=46433 RepID=X6M3S7_RETFI|nr:hypothetical protein RFI_29710 [Reticulomyxa filosa]|eukprot:ETO07680.1 hypothetical protein RFI_29710 [Reticulomyxa filosa]
MLEFFRTPPLLLKKTITSFMVTIFQLCRKNIKAVQIFLFIIAAKKKLYSSRMKSKLPKELLLSNLVKKNAPDPLRICFSDLHPTVEVLAGDIGRQKMNMIGLVVFGSLTTLNHVSLLPALVPLIPLGSVVYHAQIQHLYHQCKLLIEENRITSEENELSYEKDIIPNYSHFRFELYSKDLLFSKQTRYLQGKEITKNTNTSVELSWSERLLSYSIPSLRFQNQSGLGVILKYRFTHQILSQYIEKVLSKRRLRLYVPITATFCLWQCICFGAKIWQVEMDHEITSTQVINFFCPCVFFGSFLLLNWLHSREVVRFNQKLLKLGSVNKLINDNNHNNNNNNNKSNPTKKLLKEHWLIYDWGYIDIFGNLVCTTKKPWLRKPIVLTRKNAIKYDLHQ